MIQILADATSNPDPIFPTGVGAGGVGVMWAVWSFFLRSKIMGERPSITQAEWDTVKLQAGKVPRLETHARNMHKALRQIREYLDADETAEAKAAIRMAESLSDSHFTDGSETE